MDFTAQFRLHIRVNRLLFSHCDVAIDVIGARVVILLSIPFSIQSNHPCNISNSKASSNLPVFIRSLFSIFSEISSYDNVMRLAIEARAVA